MLWERILPNLGKRPRSRTEHVVQNWGSLLRPTLLEEGFKVMAGKPFWRVRQGGRWSGPPFTVPMDPCRPRFAGRIAMAPAIRRASRRGIKGPPNSPNTQDGARSGALRSTEMSGRLAGAFCAGECFLCRGCQWPCQAQRLIGMFCWAERAKPRGWVEQPARRGAWWSHIQWKAPPERTLVGAERD